MACCHRKANRVKPLNKCPDIVVKENVQFIRDFSITGSSPGIVLLNDIHVKQIPPRDDMFEELCKTCY